MGPTSLGDKPLPASHPGSGTPVQGAPHRGTMVRDEPTQHGVPPAQPGADAGRAEGAGRRFGEPGRLLVGLVVAAIALALAGIGVGVAALLHQPAEVVGPAGVQGARGATGAQGAPGPQGGVGATGPAGAVGPAGPAGPPGPAGPAGPAGKTGPRGTQGTVRAAKVVASPTVVSAPGAGVGTAVSATASCPAGRVLLGGGAKVATSQESSNADVALRSSYPVDSTTWKVVAEVTGQLGAGVTASVQPYVLCGTA